MSSKFESIQVGALIIGERKEYRDRWYHTRFPSFVTLWLVVGKEKTQTQYGTCYTFHLLKIFNSRKALAMESGQSLYLDYKTTTITDTHFTISANNGVRECIRWEIA